MAKDIASTVRKICLGLPETEEVRSHGMPDFRVRGKTFATYAVNHHGDGRVALWLNLTSSQQQGHVAADPKNFFVPPYVGPRGWLGARLDLDIDWRRLAALVAEAYAKVAPGELRGAACSPATVDAPTRKMSPVEIDPLQGRRAQAVLARMRRICLKLPEVREARQFGSPVWQAGRKTFAWLHHGEGRWCIYVWVGVSAQGLMCADPRFRVPAYLGPTGWIALDVTKDADWREIEDLLLCSYRHFALKRMLKKLA